MFFAMVWVMYDLKVDQPINGQINRQHADIGFQHQHHIAVNIPQSIFYVPENELLPDG